MKQRFAALRVTRSPSLLACLLPFAAAAFVTAGDLPVPYPGKPVYGHVFSASTVQQRGIVFEWWPSRHLPDTSPRSYALVIAHDSWPQPFEHVVDTSGERRLVRVRSSDIVGLDLSLPGRYRWGVTALGFYDEAQDKQITGSGDGLLRGAHFFIEEGVAEQPASLFDIHPDHHFDSRDIAALSRSWKRMQGDGGFDPFADIGGPAGAPDGIVDELDLLAVADAGRAGVRLLYPLNGVHDVILRDFQDPGVVFEWEQVRGALGYWLELDRINDQSQRVITFTFFVRGTSFNFLNTALFPVASHDLRDAEFNTMQVGTYDYRVRPLFLDGPGEPSRDERLRIHPQPFTPTPTPTPAPDQLIIDDLVIRQPTDYELVAVTEYADGDVRFLWDPARFREDSEFFPGIRVPDVSYVMEISGRLLQGQEFVPRTVLTNTNSVPSNYDGNGDQIPDLPSVGSSAELQWRVFAVAPHPTTPNRKIFSPKSDTYTLRISLRGAIPFPGDANRDDFADAYDMLWLSRSHMRLVADPRLPPAERLAMMQIRQALDVNQSRYLSEHDVLELVNFVQTGKFAHPSLPEPTPFYPPTGEVVTDPNLTLAWSEVAGASDYFVVIEMPPSLANPTGRVVFSQPANVTERPVRLPLLEGSYRWQVRAVAPEGKGVGSGLSDVQRFEFRFPPDEARLSLRADGGFQVLPRRSPDGR